MELGKVLARGQVTLPRAIRQAADVKPGDVVAFTVSAPGKVELHVLPRGRSEKAAVILSEAKDPCPRGTDSSACGLRMTLFGRSPRLRLADALKRYRVEQPVDDAHDRLSWETQAAKDVLGG